MMTRRRLAYLKILDGWQRLVVEYPEISWGLPETPETLAAEKGVARAITDYESGEPLTRVRDAFNVWKDAWINNSKPKTLFGLSKS